MPIELIIFSLAVLLEIFIVVLDLVICNRTKRRLRTYEAEIAILNVRISLFKERLDVLQYVLKKLKEDE